MPLVLEKEIPGVLKYAAWRADEPDIFYENALQLTDYDLEELEKIKTPQRRREWLASRYLLKRLCGSAEILHLKKDEEGRPFLANYPAKISISHAGSLMAVALSRVDQPGIDVEIITEKVKKIADRFLHQEEKELLGDAPPLKNLILFWSAKESIYKAYGKRQLAFKENIRLLPEKVNTAGMMKAKILKPDLVMDYTVLYGIFEQEDWLYTCALESSCLRDCLTDDSTLQIIS